MAQRRPVTSSAERALRFVLNSVPVWQHNRHLYTTVVLKGREARRYVVAARFRISGFVFQTFVAAFLTPPLPRALNSYNNMLQPRIRNGKARRMLRGSAVAAAEMHYRVSCVRPLRLPSELNDVSEEPSPFALRLCARRRLLAEQRGAGSFSAGRPARRGCLPDSPAGVAVPWGVWGVPAGRSGGGGGSSCVQASAWHPAHAVSAPSAAASSPCGGRDRQLLGQHLGMGAVRRASRSVSVSQGEGGGAAA